MLVKLKDVCKIKPGYAFNSNDFGHGAAKCIKITDISFSIQETELINVEENDKLKDFIVNDGDIIMSMTSATQIGKIGRLRKHTHTIYLNQRLCKFEADETKINKDYLFFVLSQNNFNKFIRSSADSKSLQQNISHYTIGEFTFELPNLKIQNKIAKTLSNIDNQIERNNCMVKRLQDLATSTYSRWFNQFEFPNEDGLPYKSNNGKFVYNEELKKNIPVGWEVKKLGDILKESDKSQIQVGEAKQNIGKYPFFTSGEEIVLYKDYFVNSAYCYLNTGGNADVKFFDGKASYSTDTWCISFNEYTYIMNEYLQFIKPLMDKLFFSGSGLKHLQKEAFKKQKILIPSQNIVFKYNDIVDDCHKQISKIYMKNIELNNLKSKLLPLLINGQLEV